MRLLCSIALAAAAVLSAQDADRVAVPLTDASRPATVRVDLMNGNVTVRSHTGKDVVVEMSGGARRSSRKPAEVDGLKRLDVFSSGLDVEESENTVRINSGPRSANASVTVLVPQNTSLKLKTMTGEVKVEGIKG